MDRTGDFKRLFDTLCRSHSPWQVFQDYIAMHAIALNVCSGRTLTDIDKHEERERRYLAIMEGYQPDEQELFPQLAAITTDALDENPYQDFLGNLYMSLGLGDSWKGQFFTPYAVCEEMARITVEEARETATERLQTRGYISAMDPACGAGATLVAVRNELIGQVPLNHVLFYGQDLSINSVYMAYIQLGLLGCCGYIVCGDSLLHPLHTRGWQVVPDEYYTIWTLPMTPLFMPFPMAVRKAEPPEPVYDACEDGQLRLF